MALVGITEGLKAFMEPNALNAGGTNFKIHLYTNNHAPAASDTLAGNYVECADASYAAVALTAGSWVFTSPGGVTTATYPAITFNFAASATIYGYYVTDTASTKVVWAEEFTGAPLTFSSTFNLVLTPVITLQ
jgi:hypothetical protein